MTSHPSPLTLACDRIVAAVRPRLDHAPAPVLVALDGGSGCGKSTLAAMVAGQVGGVVIPGDDFFAANLPEAEWDARSPAEKARDCIDWRRMRTEALEPLLAGQPARWHAFDFESGPRPDGTYGMKPTPETRPPAPVIVLDGIYSARPELVDLAVLVDVPVAVRHARLAAREDAAFLAAWHARWDDAEAYYLRQVRPAGSFDLVVTNS